MPPLAEKSNRLNGVTPSFDLGYKPPEPTEGNRLAGVVLDEMDFDFNDPAVVDPQDIDVALPPEVGMPIDELYRLRGQAYDWSIDIGLPTELTDEYYESLERLSKKYGV